jgi:hypothetical protein
MVATAKAMSELVNRCGWLRLRNPRFAVRVMVVDARHVYGQLQVQVVPISGDGPADAAGGAWVAAYRVELDASDRKAA